MRVPERTEPQDRSKVEFLISLQVNLILNCYLSPEEKPISNYSKAGISEEVSFLEVLIRERLTFLWQPSPPSTMTGD